MRFLLVLVSFTSSIAMAEVSNFNELVRESTRQEKRLHRKLLQAIQNTQVAIAYNDRWESLRGSEASQKSPLSVRLVQAEQ
ncbi:MAG: hypothetical protein KUL82_06945 [Bdellovibrio sp.]|nr:hypothetical protein [Bdellovibrio sp.]